MADGDTAIAESVASDPTPETPAKPETPSPREPEQPTPQSPEKPAGLARYLKKEHQAHPDVAQFGSASDLFEEYLKLKDRDIQPDPEASAEVWAEYHASHGRPQSPNDYQLPELPKEIAEGADAYPAWFKQAMFEVGASQRQARQFWDKTVANAVEQATQRREAREKRAEAADKALRDEWGEHYNGNTELAKRAMRTFIDAEAFKELEPVMTKNPAIVQAFAKIGDAISEDSLEGGRPEGATPALLDVNPGTGRRRLKL